MRALLGPCVLALVAAGCTVDRGSAQCTEDGQCAPERRCYRGFCVLREELDAGVRCTPTSTACESTALGACEPGRELVCEDEVTRCESVVTQTAEMCNGEDDDCDGRTDEDFLPLNSTAHCGACGASCGAGLQCCAEHDEGGALRCVDTTSDDEFCGGCPADQACDVAGGERCCGSSCRNLLADRANCGVCGRECPDGQRCCGGDCVSINSDPRNCGGCGTECGAGTRCCQGVCAAPISPRCGDCTEDCGTLACCNGSCVDLQTDRNACGNCATVCDEGEFCCGGQCVVSDEEHCGACGVVCAENELCCNDACVANNSPNCGACGATCAPGTACCGGGCVDLQSDEANCGTCGNGCAAGQTCSAGRCCGANLTNCGGTCVDLQTSGSNCGRCGRSCALGCRGGACVLL